MLKNILIKISKILFLLIPRELKIYDYHFHFTTLQLQKKLFSNLVDETFIHFKEIFKKSLLFEDAWKLREYAITSSLYNDKNKDYFYLEFGVYKGSSANYFSNFLNHLYVFDSFEGLKEDWVGINYTKGHFNLNKKIPKLNSNVTPIVGWVEDTLELFLKEHNPKINFVHFDMDTYSPTKYTLQKIKPYLVKDAILIFDQLYNYIGWEHGEYKALKEVFSQNDIEFTAFNLAGKQAVIKIKNQKY